MKQVEVAIPELMGIAVTRGMLGAGLALLLGDRLERRNRRKLGTILLWLGVLSTAPFAWDLFYRRGR